MDEKEGVIINKTYNEKCIDTIRRMPNEFINLTVTSPPYDNLRTYGDHPWNWNIFIRIARGLWRVTKRGGIVVWIVGDATIKGSETGTSFKQALYFKKCGFNLHDTMIYKKTGLTFPEINRYYPQFEYMFIFSKGKPVCTNLIADRINKHAGNRPNSRFRRKDGSFQKKSRDKLGINKKIKDVGIRFNIWEISHRDSARSLGHPATFPEQLVHDHIISWSNEGDLVYDPFMGSGTTRVVAESLNRNYTGSEIFKKYCDINKKR